MATLPIQKFNSKSIDSGDMSGNLKSDPLEIKEAALICIQAKWSGSGLSGSLSIQGSNFPLDQLSDDSNWTEISSATISTDSGNTMLNIDRAGQAYIRVVYTSLSGAGSLTVLINGKVI